MFDFVLFLWETTVGIFAAAADKPWLLPVAKVVAYILKLVVYIWRKFGGSPKDE